MSISYSHLPHLAYTAIAALLVASTLSCSRHAIDIDKNDDLGLTPGVNYLVLILPYSSFFMDSSYSSNIVSYESGVHVHLITGMRIIDSDTVKGKKIRWYNCEKGWIPQSDIKVFDNEMKAKSYAKKLSIGEQ